LPIWVNGIDRFPNRQKPKIISAPHLTIYSIAISIQFFGGHMSENISVHILQTPEPPVFDYLKSLVKPSITLTTGDIPSIAEYQMIIGGRPEPEQLDASPNLKTLVIPFSGMPPHTKALAFITCITTRAM
jgi:hypothetical protein